MDAAGVVVMDEVHVVVVVVGVVLVQEEMGVEEVEVFLVVVGLEEEMMT